MSSFELNPTRIKADTVGIVIMHEVKMHNCHNVWSSRPPKVLLGWILVARNA